MLVGCLAITMAAAGITVALVRGQVDQLASALGTNKSLAIKGGVLAPTAFGGPQTLLLIGNDQRAHTTTTPVLPHANEMLLVRFDPSKPWISMMSIPRELEVPIHTPDDGVVTTRLNAALFYGGIPLVVSTIKQVTGLSVNHVVVIDFQNFVRAVNDMGCVYATIDRRYYHVNTPTSAQYTQVNLQPGYQKLCGRHALQFVTYRHTDTSLERDARDQSFLLAVKQEFGPTLIDNIGKFERIFGSLVQTDSSLHTTQGVTNLLGTLIHSAGLPVRQVQFRANLGAVTSCACVTANAQQIRASVHSFLYGTGRPPSRQSTAKLARRSRRPNPVKTSAQPLVPTPAAARTGAERIARRLSFPMEFPSVEINNGYGFPTDFRSYRIRAPGGQRYPIYVAVFSTGLLGQYYDVQGTTWTTAPTFDSPGQSVTVGGRTYYIYYSGSRIVQVAWFANGAAYWVRNTLTLGLTNAQMLAISERTALVSGGHEATSRTTRTTYREQANEAPAAVIGQGGSSALSAVGLIGGALAMLLLPLGLIGFLTQRRRTLGLREPLDELNTRLALLERRLSELQLGPSPSDIAEIPENSGAASVAWSTAASQPVRVYTTGRRVGRTVVTAATALIVAAALIAGVLILIPSSGASADRHRTLSRPTSAVAVLNAGDVQGAAARLGRRLLREGVRVVGVANLGASVPNGVEVLYRAGDRSQAMAVAELLRSSHPTVAPVYPTAAAAAGSRAGVVVVIS